MCQGFEDRNSALSLDNAKLPIKKSHCDYPNLATTCIFQNDYTAYASVMSKIDQILHFYCARYQVYYYFQNGSCVSSGGAPTPGDTLLFIMWNFHAYTECEVKT